MKIKPLSIATMIIFGTGVATGGLWVNHIQDAKPRPASRHGASGGHQAAALHPPEILSQPFLQTLDKKLELTPGQRDAIQRIMSDGQNRLRKVVQDSRLEIREALTPAERTKFDALVSRRFHHPLFTTNSPPSFTGCGDEISAPVLGSSPRGHTNQD